MVDGIVLNYNQTTTFAMEKYNIRELGKLFLTYKFGKYGSLFIVHL